jgi:hypothetical protein
MQMCPRCKEKEHDQSYGGCPQAPHRALAHARHELRNLVFKREMDLLNHVEGGEA